MNYFEASRAIADAKDTVEQGNRIIRGVANLLSGNLKTADIDGDILKKLKRELKNFNIQTARWKD